MRASRPPDPGPIPPRLLVALALVAAAGSTLLAVLVTMPAVSPSDFQDVIHFGFFDRVQIGTRLLDIPVLLLVPVAVLLARLVERGGGGQPPGARTVLLGATTVGAALALFVLLRLVARLGGQEYLVDPTPRVGSFFYDLGALMVAVAGPYWAYRELQRMRPGGDPGPEPTPGPGTFPPPPSVPPGGPRPPPAAG